MKQIQCISWGKPNEAVKKTNAIYLPAADLEASLSIDLDNTLKQSLICVDDKSEMSPL